MVWQLKKKEILYELWGRIIAAESDCKMQITRHSLFLYFHISQQWLIPADSCLLTCLLMSWWCSKVNKDHVSLIIRVSEETTRYLKLIQFRRNIVLSLISRDHTNRQSNGNTDMKWNDQNKNIFKRNKRSQNNKVFTRNENSI